MYCVNCGHELDDTALYCPNCGYAVKKNASEQPNSAKSRLVAGLFGLFLGGLGVHNFYLAFFVKGTIQACLFGAGLLLTLTIIGALIGIPMMIASSIWGFVEGILIISGYYQTDGKGNPISGI